MHPGADTRLRGLAGEPDERLVARVRAGDERAFDEIVTRYRAPLLRYVRRYLAPAAAEDALQQAFINAYAALTSEAAKVPVSLRPWMYRVAHNAALNAGRDPQAAFAPLPEGLDGVERPEEALQRSERLWNVVRAVRALPEKQRQVIVRHALDGDSHEQIAADLGVSAGAVRQLAHRARRTVREAAASLVPVWLLRWLPWGSALAESPAAGGGAGGAKVAAAVVATAVAGGGAVEIARHDREGAVRDVAARVAPAPAQAAERPAKPPRVVSVPAVAQTRGAVGGDTLRSRGGGDPSGGGRSGGGDSGSDSGGSGAGAGGSGSSGSGSGTSGGGTSGSGGSGSGSDTSGSSGSGSSGSGTSGGSGTGGSGSSGSGSGTSGGGSESSGSGSSGSGTSGSGSSGSESSGSGGGEYVSSGSGTSGSGSGEYDTSGSGTSGSGSDEYDSSGSGSSGSGGSGSG